MKKDVIICIGTVGYPTFSKCHEIAQKIYSENKFVTDIAVIENKYPQSEWLNEMRVVASNNTWCLQIDEDMYLYDNAVDELINLARKKTAEGVNILNASSLLFDIFLKSNIGSLKLWNTEAFKHVEFKDIKGSDRQFAKDAESFGFSNVSTNKVLGEHDSAPNIEIAYFKYKEYVVKIRKFEGDRAARFFVRDFKKRCNKNGLIGKFAHEGAVSGLTVAVSELYTKNYINNLNSDEILELKRRYNII